MAEISPELDGSGGGGAEEYCLPAARKRDNIHSHAATVFLGR